MAHNVESMAFYGETPWHGLGTKVGSAMTSEEALVKAGLDWDVLRLPVPHPILKNADGTPRTIPGYMNIVRSTDSKVLSIMSDEYKPHAPKDAFRFFDVLVGKKYAMYHTAGSLGGGAKIWILAKIPGEIRVPNTDDVVEKYALLATSFDGSLKTIVKLTPQRVVCQNTLNEAVRGSGEFIAIRHRSTLESRMEEAQRVLGVVQKQYEVFERNVQKFARARFSEKQMEALAANLFPASKETGEVSTKARSSRELLLNLFESGKGQEMVRGSAWAAFNSVTEFVDHHRDTRLTKRSVSALDQKANSLLFGTGAEMKRAAFAYIDETIDAAVPGVTFTA